MYCECEYGDGRLPLLFIVNPAAHSGEGYALWKQAEAVLQERSIPYEVYFSEKRGDVRQLAKRLTNVSEGAERFLMCSAETERSMKPYRGCSIRTGRSVISRPVRVTIWRGI